MGIRFFRTAFILLATALLSIQATAQILAPVKWTFTTEQDGDKTYAVYTAAIDENWYVYSQFLESEDGPEATTINYEGTPATQIINKSVESGNKKAGFDKIFGMNVVKFARKYVIKQQVKFVGDKPIKGYLTFMTCDDSKCLPPTDVDFQFNAPAKPIKRVAEQNVVSAEPSLPAIVQQVEAAVAEVEQEVKSVRPGILVPVTWKIATKKISETTYLLRWTANIQDGWTVYSQELAEDGPIPTSFTFDKTGGYKRLGKVTEKGNRKSGFDKVFEVNVTKYLAPQVTFEQRVELSDPNATVLGFLEFMSCDATQCLPPEERFWRFQPSKGIAEFINLDLYEAYLSAAEAGTALADVDELPATDVAIDSTAASADDNAKYEFNKENEAVTCGTTTRETDVDKDAGLLTVFLLGFGGGLLALLTPCVFPMIPLTVSFFTGRGKDRKKGLRRALIYGASIIAIYVTLGLLITGLFGADALNLLSTNAWFNLIFGLLFLVFAFSFFGFFEITLPSSWANKTDRAADQGGLLGIFFMAFTLSLVSFSCTGPIIGTLLVETATGGGATIFGRIPVAPLVGMLGFSGALALPFTLFAAFPSALESLPKSGGWMNTVKVTLGFVEVALAMKFLSTADLIMGTKWMPYELFIVIWVLCALGLGAYYFGWLKTPLDYGKRKATPIMMGLGALAFMFAGYVAAGLFYDEQSDTFDTPGVLSGLAPPAGHSYTYPKKCPQNLNCFKDYDEALAFAKEVNKPVLVDFTGHGCVNCRKMEDYVWDKPGVYDRIRDDYVLVSLYVDEREPLDAPFTSEFSGQKIRTVGNKWADFQARYFDRNSQPYYVLVSPQGDVLNQPVPYTPDVTEYAAFLDCGMQQFEKLQLDASEGGLSEL